MKPVQTAGGGTEVTQPVGECFHRRFSNLGSFFWSHHCNRFNDLSTAWNDETRQRVLRAAQELGYTPHTAARALVTSKSYLLGSVLCQSADQVFSDAFLPDVLRGVSQTELGIRESCGHTLEGL